MVAREAVTMYSFKKKFLNFNGNSVVEERKIRILMQIIHSITDPSVKFPYS